MQKELSVAITGATGFIGRNVISRLADAGLTVVALSRAQVTDSPQPNVIWRVIPDYSDHYALIAALEDVSCVIHLADNPSRGNYPDGVTVGLPDIVGSLTFAMKARRIRKIIIVSSVYARLAEEGYQTNYGKAKLEVENRFRQTHQIQSIILRLPPVYGPGSRGGFASLVKLVRSGIPIPLLYARAPRDYLSVKNLAELFLFLLKADLEKWEKNSGKSYEPSDGVPISTSNLARSIGKSIGKPARLLPFPITPLRVLAYFLGKQELIRGILQPLIAVKEPSLENDFGWRPMESMPESLEFLSDGVA